MRSNLQNSHPSRGGRHDRPRPHVAQLASLQEREKKTLKSQHVLRAQTQENRDCLLDKNGDDGVPQPLLFLFLPVDKRTKYMSPGALHDQQVR